MTEDKDIALEKGSSLWSDAWQRLRKNSLAMAGLAIILFILISCFIGPLLFGILDINANSQDPANSFAKPSGKHWLGTDQLGRDLMARILEGGQISLLIALVASALTVSMGIIYGGIAGYIGGRTEAIMMRLLDGLLAMPFLIVVILFRELIKARIDETAKFLINEWNWAPDAVLRYANIVPLIFAIAAFGWLTMGRIVRGQAATLVKLEYVEAARSLGLSHLRILFRHILPNMLGPVIIYATLTIPSFILTEATLSFIGLGVEPPYSSWGTLIKEGVNFLETKPSLLFIPGIFFSLTLFAFNFLGDGLRDALDPKASKD